MVECLCLRHTYEEVREKENICRSMSTAKGSNLLNTFSAGPYPKMTKKSLKKMENPKRFDA